MEQKCETCKFFQKLKLHKTKEPPIEYEIKSCCTMLPRTEPGYDSFVLDVEPNEVCEMWTERKLCDNCCHLLLKDAPYGKNTIMCEVYTGSLIHNYHAEKCEYYNKDMSDQNICLNCVHFRGGGDWGLACAKHYHRLPKALSETCVDVGWKDGCGYDGERTTGETELL